MAQPPRHRIHIDIEASAGRRILLHLGQDAGGAKFPFETCITREGLASFRGGISRSLEELKTIIGNHARLSNWNKVTKVVHRLERIGAMAAMKLFGTRARLFAQKIQELCPGWTHDSEEAPVIIVTGGSDYVLPIEFLPCMPGDTNALNFGDKISDTRGMEEALRKFLGYSCVVSRVIEAGEVVPQPLRTSPLCAVKIFVNNKLPGARKETRDLTRLHKTFKTFTWPKRGRMGNVRELADHLITLDAQHYTDAKLSDQIHHFATHCDTTADDSDDHSLQLAGCARTEFTVVMRDLIAELGILALEKAEEAQGTRLGPLVFLNACGSSVIKADQAVTFPSLFMCNLRSRGYIGTETAMSDEIAQKYSAEFYERLLGGTPVGKALLESRQSILKKYNNPLGLFYTSYTHPDLRMDASG